MYFIERVGDEYLPPLPDSGVIVHDVIEGIDIEDLGPKFQAMLKTKRCRKQIK